MWLKFAPKCVSLCAFCFRRRVLQVLGSDTTRRTHCAVAVEVAVIIFRRRPVLDVAILQSVCGNVSFNTFKLIVLLLSGWNLNAHTTDIPGQCKN